jgi:hypothetical protein
MPSVTNHVSLDARPKNQNPLKLNRAGALNEAHGICVEKGAEPLS